MTYLSLFSGIGGLDLGLDRAGFNCVGQVECDHFAREVLAKHWPHVERWEFVQHILKEARNGRRFSVDAVVGGFPCQDISVAGKGAGIFRGTRSGLWWAMLELICLIQPRWVIAENVPALRTRGADAVLSSLSFRGYSAEAIVVGAEHVGAPHRRHRVFIVANANSDTLRQQRRRAREDGAEEAELEWAGRKKANRQSGGLGTDRRTSRDTGHDDECHAGMGDSDSGRRGKHESGRGSEGGVAAGRTGEAVANPEGRKWRSGEHDESESVGQRESGRCREMADAQRPRLEGLGADTGQPERPEPRDGGTSVADSNNGTKEHGRQARGLLRGRIGATGVQGWQWPAGPGPQHEWEPPRLVELPLGWDVDGVPARLLRFANKHALKAYGNAVVPQVAEVIGRAILVVEGGAA